MTRSVERTDEVSLSRKLATGLSDNGQGAGAALRALRESKGLTLEDASAYMKHPVSRIQALEEERWDVLPKGTALRGMIRNYARFLGADGQALVQALEPAIGKTGAGLGESVLAKGVPDIRERAQVGSWVWLFTLLLVCAAVLAYASWQGWLPADWWSGEGN
ncbi:MAG: helix-turn-helix domain-containing protein [Corticimicrobacter sp.]|uniref:helix-turn-helix domain-containing protein n=1 Tax=Corticimicrobacter sp. TaxID=2678536 RepID=UPI0032D9EA4D